MTSLNSFIFIAESYVVPKVHEGHEFWVSENAPAGCAIHGAAILIVSDRDDFEVPMLGCNVQARMKKVLLSLGRVS